MKVMSHRSVQQHAQQVEAADRAWQVAGWIGAALAVVGLVDVALVLYPWNLGQPAWAFGVMDAAVSTLPLLVVGWAAMVGSAVARGLGTAAVALGGSAVALGVMLLVGYGLYLPSVPLALRIAPDEVMVGIHKSIVRVTVMTLAFGAVFIVGGIAAMRSRAA